MLAVLEFRVIVAGHIDLAPDDRLDLEMPRCLVHVLVRELEELLDSVHVTVVGDGQGRHSHLLSPVKQSGNRGETVKNRVLCVDVKVNKGHGDKSIFNHQNKSARHRLSFPTSGRLRQYKDTEKPYPRKAALPEKLSTLRKKSRFHPSKTRNNSRYIGAKIRKKSRRHLLSN